MLAGTAAAIAAFSGFAPQLLAGGEIGEIVFMISGFLLLGLAFGQASGAVASNFPMNYRYTGSALTSDLAWLFGAGFAPWVALAMSSRFGLAFGGAYLLSGAVGTLDRAVHQPPDRSRPRGTVMSTRLRNLAILPLCAALSACDAVVLNPSGDVAVQQRDLLVHRPWLMLLIIVPVMALTVLFAWRYRHTNREARYEPDWDHSMRLELVIWSAPLLIIICLGALTWLGTHLLDPYRPLDRIAPGQPVPEDAQAAAGRSRRARLEVAVHLSASTASPPSTSWRCRSNQADRAAHHRVVGDELVLHAGAGRQIYAMPGMETRLHAVLNKPASRRASPPTTAAPASPACASTCAALEQASFDRWVATARAAQETLTRDAYLQLAKPSSASRCAISPPSTRSSTTPSSACASSPARCACTT